ARSGRSIGPRCPPDRPSGRRHAAARGCTGCCGPSARTRGSYRRAGSWSRGSWVSWAPPWWLVVGCLVRLPEPTRERPGARPGFGNQSCCLRRRRRRSSRAPCSPSSSIPTITCRFAAGASIKTRYPSRTHRSTSPGCTSPMATSARPGHPPRISAWRVWSRCANVESADQHQMTRWPVSSSVTIGAPSAWHQTRSPGRCRMMIRSSIRSIVSISHPSIAVADYARGWLLPADGADLLSAPGPRAVAEDRHRDRNGGLADRGAESPAMARAFTSWRPLKGAQNRAALLGAHVGPLGPGRPIVWPHFLPFRVGARPQPDLAAVRQDGREGDVVSWESFAELNFVTAVLKHVLFLSV